MSREPRADWKAIQIPYDHIAALPDTERCYRLSDRTVALLLSQIGYAYWPSRWYKDTPLTDVEIAQLKAMAALAEAQLMAAELCCEEQIMDVRQNPEDPCILEKTFDGLEWTPFADLSLCIPKIRRDPRTGHYQWSVDNIDFFEFPDGPWVDAPPEYLDIMPPARTEAAPEDRLCLASANAAHVLRKLYERTQRTLLQEIVDQIDVGETIFSFLYSILPGPLQAVVDSVVVLPVAGALIAIQLELTGNDFTDEAEEELKCLIYDCATDTDSVVTIDYVCLFDSLAPYGFGNFPELDLLRVLLPAIGGDGLNLAATLQLITSADCECSEECQRNITFGSGIPQGVYRADDGPIADPTPPNDDGQWSSDHGGTLQVSERPNGQPRNEMWFYIDLGEECPFQSWTLETLNTSEDVNYKFRMYMDVRNAANEIQGGSMEFFIDGTNTWEEQAFTNVPIDTPIRYLLFGAWDFSALNNFTFYVDNIKVNLA